MKLKILIDYELPSVHHNLHSSAVCIYTFFSTKPQHNPTRYVQRIKIQHTAVCIDTMHRIECRQLQLLSTCEIICLLKVIELQVYTPDCKLPSSQNTYSCITKVISCC